MTDRHATPSRLWIKLDALIHRNPKAAKLTDAQFRAYVTSLCEAKLTQSEGEWRDQEHYAFAVGSRVARHLPALLAAGLLEQADDGWISVHDWTDWQTKDPTSAERSRRYREKQRAERNGRGVTRDGPSRHTDRGDRHDTVDPSGVTTGLKAVTNDGCPVCGRPMAGYTSMVELNGERVEMHDRCIPEVAA